MRKRMETEERDATSRASFKCPNCLKTFTDLEVIVYNIFTCNFYYFQSSENLYFAIRQISYMTCSLNNSCAPIVNKK